MAESFGHFYSEIRTHFSRNLTDFEDFKRRSSGKKKIEFLLEHEVVQNGIQILNERNVFPETRKAPEQIPESGDYPISTKIDGLKGSSKYPQLSQKVCVQDSKKKGRHLVAKEKINPGNFFQLIS